jgi:hypothetical protein
MISDNDEYPDISGRYSRFMIRFDCVAVAVHPCFSEKSLEFELIHPMGIFLGGTSSFGDARKGGEKGEWVKG